MGGTYGIDVKSEGDCVFASGETDFGEWFEIGDPLEWTSQDEVDKRINLNVDYFGIPEGTIYLC